MHHYTIAMPLQAAARKQEAGYWKSWWARFSSMSYGAKNAVYRKVRPWRGDLLLVLTYIRVEPQG